MLFAVVYTSMCMRFSNAKRGAGMVYYDFIDGQETFEWSNGKTYVVVEDPRYCHTEGKAADVIDGKSEEDCEGCYFEGDIEGCFFRTGHPEDI